MKITINGIEMQVDAGMTVLAAAAEQGIVIPTLCYLKGINEVSSCRVCVVEIKGRKGMFPACTTVVEDGMEVYTDTESVYTARKDALELICANHVMDCTNCSRGMNCELRYLCQKYAVDDRRFGLGKREKLFDESTSYLVRDNTKCILCRRCVSVCEKVQAVEAIAVNNRGKNTNIGFGIPLKDTKCVACGQCIRACPTGALREKDDTKQVWKAIFDKKKTVIAALSNDTCNSIGKLLGESLEIDCSGKIISILRQMGFDAIYNTDIIHDTYETMRNTVVNGMLNRGKKPVIDGNCSSVRNYIKQFYPQYEENLLTFLDKKEFFAKLIKGKYHDKNICLVNIDNCIAAKQAIHDEKHFVDVAITTRELVSMMHQACVSTFTMFEVWKQLSEDCYDTALPEEKDSVCKVPEVLSGNCVSVYGLANVKAILLNAESYDYIEAYACSEGCINGGGALHKY